jgi:hypothetical protein
MGREKIHKGTVEPATVQPLWGQLTGSDPLPEESLSFELLN